MRKWLPSRVVGALETTGLCALALSLPIMETPKQASFYLIAAAAVLAFFFKPEERSLAPSDGVEWILLLGLSACLASTFVNWPLANGFKGVRDAACYTFLFFWMRRRRWTMESSRRFLLFFAAGLFAATLFGIRQWSAGGTVHLEFHSVGVVTQSAAYAAMSVLVFAGVYLDSETGFSKKFQYFSAACAVFMFGVLLAMGSRGGLLAFGVVAVCLIFFLFKSRKFRFLLYGCGLASIAITGIVASHYRDTQIFDRIRHIGANLGAEGFTLDKDFPQNDMLRIEHWRLGIKQALEGENKLLGMGPRNFPFIDVESFSFDPPLKTYPSLWTRPNHAHNLFITKWAEEGIVGLTLFLLFLLAAGRILFVERPSPGKIRWSWIAGVAALLIPVICGTFNSPLKNENAWLSMMLLGMALARSEKMSRRRA